MTDKSGWVVGKVIAGHAAARGDQPFIQFQDGQPYTYGQVHEITNRVGNALAGIGVQVGESVAVMLHNRLEYLWSWFGINQIGAVHVGINTAYKGIFLSHVLNNAGARVGIMEPEFLPWLADVEQDVPALEVVYVPGPALRADALPSFRRIEVRAFDALMQGAPDEIDVAVSYRDIGVIMYTSGTTGPSKGVLMPHAHLYLFALGLRDKMGVTADDVMYSCMPLFHNLGMLLQIYGSLIAGARVVLVPGFSATNWIEDIRKYGATVTNNLGVMNDFILRQPPKPTDTDHKLRIMTAIPVTAETQQAMRQRYGIPKLMELFGMTECNVPIWRPLDAPEEAGCSGAVWEEYFACIVADPDTDEEVPRGNVGELLVRPREPYGFMAGYNRMPEKTVEANRNFWFHTGDAARMDERGFVWYIDRIKDTIRRRGENISSYEVEAVLLEHPAVEEVAAVAVKADTGGEDEVLACIILRDGVEPPQPEALLDFCASRMPYFAVPRYVEFLDEIPKTPSQKIQKNKLRERGISPHTWDRESVGYKVSRR